MAKVKRIVKGEKYPRGIKDLNLEKQTCTIQHVTKLDNGLSVWLEHEVDLSNTSETLKFQHAVADMVIKRRGRAFKGKTVPAIEKEFEAGYVFKPENYPPERSNGVDPVTKVDRMFAKMSRLEKIAWLTNKGLDDKTAASMVDSGNV